MSKSYFYRFICHVSAPATGEIKTAFILESERADPIDRRLYRKIRRLAFAHTDKKFWSSEVEIYRFSDAEANDSLVWSKSNPKYLGIFVFTRYTNLTCFAAIVSSCLGSRSCWNWPDRSAPYDWDNHADHWPNTITKVV